MMKPPKNAIFVRNEEQNGGCLFKTDLNQELEKNSWWFAYGRQATKTSWDRLRQGHLVDVATSEILLLACRLESIFA